MPMIEILKAAASDIDDLAPLFDEYRIFYRQASGLTAAASFLRQRIDNEQSTIFMAKLKDRAVGFTQLYPIYSSVSLLPLHVLNDLYVDELSRGFGIATLLINEAKSFAIERGSKGLILETHKDNPAQQLYERLGFVKDQTYLHYAWSSPGLEESPS